MTASLITALEPSLEAFQHGRLNLADLAAQWREAARLHEPALPERYLEVLDRVLSQLESSALFSEESCSFSQADLIAALRDWLHRAAALG